jgi:hypothetical protein
MDYRFVDDIGLDARASFWLDGAQFRLNRQDTVAQQVPLGAPALVRQESAFNNLRYQCLRHHAQEFLVCDGNISAVYSLGVPITQPYSFLFRSTPLRWDTLVSEEAWDAYFAIASYAGRHEIDGHVCEVFERPGASQNGQPGAVVCRACFAVDANYLPIRLDCRNRSTDELLSWQTVPRFREFRSPDGTVVVVPLEVHAVVTGVGNAGLKSDERWIVDESTIRVNEPIDQALFTLERPDGWTVYDVDEVNRYSASVAVAAPDAATTFVPPTDSRWPTTVVLGFLFAALFFGAAYFVRMRAS